MLTMLNKGIRHIESRVALEEADRFEREADVGYRHDGPFFRARNVMYIHDIPEDDIGVLDRTIRLCPGGQSAATRMLIGIIARRVALLGRVRRHPEVLVNKACTFEDTGGWM